MAPAIAALSLSLSTQAALSCDGLTPYDTKSVMRYVDLMPRTFEKLLEGRAAEQRADTEFARTNDAVVLEGPWDEVPAVQVAYVGIDECGERVRLDEIAADWRYSPLSSVMLADGEAKIVVRAEPDAVVVRRVFLGRQMEGMVVGRAGGVALVQAHGVIDGKDYYFRSRGEHWSMSIGGDLHADPDWYYEEQYGTWPDAGRISIEQAYDFIAKAAVKFRAGVPTMTTRTVDKGTQSILDAIQQLKPE